MHLEPLKIHRMLQPHPARYCGCWFSNAIVPRILATDGRVAAIIPVADADGDIAGPIPMEALKALAKGRSHATLVMNGDVTVTKGGTTTTCGAANAWDSDTPPDIDMVVPTQAKADERICIDVSLLMRLAEALGSDKLELSIIDSMAPIRVDAVNSNNYGAIMPVSVEGS